MAWGITDSLRNNLTLIIQQTNKWFLMPNAKALLKPHGLNGTLNCHCNNSSVKKYDCNTIDGIHFVQASDTPYQRQLVSHTWKTDQHNLGTISDHIYRFKKFNCELLTLQVLMIAEYYYLLLVYPSRWWPGTYHLRYKGTKKQKSKNSQHHLTLTGDGICTCQQKA